MLIQDANLVKGKISRGKMERSLSLKNLYSKGGEAQPRLLHLFIGSDFYDEPIGQFAPATDEVAVDVGNPQLLANEAQTQGVHEAASNKFELPFRCYAMHLAIRY